MPKIRRAIVSVSDKRGLVPLVQALVKLGVEILSTGGTAWTLSEAGFATTSIATYTGAPEILDGRVKTLHPRIHGGLLGRPIPTHEAEMAQHGIQPIDLVVVNLYPFRETIARPGTTLEEAIENIDIGGPSMLRSAAKNYERVAVVVDPDDYTSFVAELEARGGEVSKETRFALACKAFTHTASYDKAIADYLSSTQDVSSEPFPEVLSPTWRRERLLRYGENPHQKAAFYVDDASRGGGRPSLGRANVLQGKELSYNNLLDLDAALECVLEFERPAAVIVKHTNPCGVAEDAGSISTAYRRARDADPVSAFGGIVAVNRPVDAELARDLSETFLECVVAPSFEQEAVEVLSKKKNLRLVSVGSMSDRSIPKKASIALRTVSGGVLVQERDLELVAAAKARVVTRRAPSADELAGLDFAWRVAKHVKSNAIVFARPGQVVAVGAGQMSRVDSVKIATQKAQVPTAGSVVASDAFFPFRDGVEVLAQAGATAIIQPGGSVRDDEVIAAADEFGLAMLFTGMRHFRH
ncbi:MAG: bifunctional phosphoribosylaminoimidazolecarboxamide formyltransferase/IMP cyclohydrolase [Deltaproteobacteria bacterium]|nr:bifunctional phosphoribosylaminoimidazolecarboxamide formyltransferase/IMP cyclohydrolase [Deltaproteobacteria bacterium]